MGLVWNTLKLPNAMQVQCFSNELPWDVLALQEACFGVRTKLRKSNIGPHLSFSALKHLFDNDKLKIAQLFNLKMNNLVPRPSSWSTAPCILLPKHFPRHAHQTVPPHRLDDGPGAPL